jgi:N-acetylglucosaminyldiphosphoundecaprenol N-acetyl-beta-D-mannosaminyltransferase
MFQQVEIFEVPYAVVDYQLATDHILDKAEKRVSYSVYALPVHGLVEAQHNAEMMQSVKTADMICPDGQPIRWVMNHFYHSGLKDRVYGPELTLRVLRAAEKKNMKVFLYGGSTEETTKKFKEFIETSFPGIEICGHYREDFPDGNTLNPDVINASKAQIVLVGRGCPRQEIWIANHKERVNAVMMGVGAAFAFHAGMIKQAPRWMQNNGLEWLFRLLSEPKRLWKRYLTTNFYFLYLVTKKKFHQKIFPT